MNKEEFVAKIAERVDVKAKDAVAVIDATIAELFAPAIFGTSRDEVLGCCNNCNNNCPKELARIAPTRVVERVIS